MTVSSTNNERRATPRWPAALAVLAIGGMYLVISDRYAVGPKWLVLAIVVALLLPLNVAHLRGNHQLTRWIGLALTVTMTCVVGLSAGFLVTRLQDGKTPAPSLLRDAALIWVANILTFALWYWEIDAGGPAQRHRNGHSSVDFVFPQAAATSAANPSWMPHFVDYLFLAFNTSTAFSPTDTMVLSRRAKMLMMAQSLISLVVVAVLAARAINTL